MRGCIYASGVNVHLFKITKLLEEPWSHVQTFKLKFPTIRGLYPPPQIPCGVHVESRSIPGVHVDFRHFFFGGSPANFLSRIYVESMQSPIRLQLLHLDNMDSTSEHREYEFTQQDSIWSPHGFIAFACLMLFII